MKAYNINETQLNGKNTLKPREKMQRQGIKALNDKELLALLLGTGSGKKGVMSLSREILSFMESKDYSFTVEELSLIKGVGTAKSSQLMAVYEIARRYSEGNSLKVTSPEIVQKILFNYADRPNEYFFALTLNGAHELIKRHIISTGNLNRVYVHPREVFIEVIKDRAAAVILAHNHPSGSLEPSDEDRSMTSSLTKVSLLLSIPLLDHVVFSRKGFYSFMEHGEMPH